MTWNFAIDSFQQEFITKMTCSRTFDESFLCDIDQILKEILKRILQIYRKYLFLDRYFVRVY